MLPLIDDIPSFPLRITTYAVLFILGCFLLEAGADRFVDSTAILGRRLHISQIALALLTAGAEFEELAVTIAAIAQGHGDLGLGNVVGSCIANILGSFSLGLLFPGRSGIPALDRSAKVYAGLMVVVSVFVCGLAWGRSFTPEVGFGLIASFVGYLGGIGYGIYKGIMEPPEASDSDSDSDEDNREGNSSSDDSSMDGDGIEGSRSQTAANEQSVAVEEAGSTNPSTTTPLLPNRQVRYPKFHSNSYHVLSIVLSLLALSLSGYLLAGSCTAFASAAGISDTIVGLTLLSFTTTLPEKLVAVIAARRGHSGILVANTVGSNIFLLTLVLGITLVSGGVELDEKTRWFDTTVMVGSVLAFAVVIWTGLLKKWVGGLMLGAYVAYIVGNFFV
ncbi:hypothetical protein HK104_000489 [Borealophlyctis nickersoniae]|nr:hypothetical protein HK104_000489 [Borealophlyctis nickersoniae]